MNDCLTRLQRALATSRGRRLLAGRAFVIALTMALLVIPSTCAQMVGPHSIFTDPMSGDHDHHHHAGSTAQPGFGSVEDIAWHVINGDGSPGWMLSGGDKDDDCPTTPRMRDLPSTMTMSAANAPLTLDCGITLELPAADEPAVADSPMLFATIPQIEPPPPR